MGGMTSIDRKVLVLVAAALTIFSLRLFAARPVTGAYGFRPIPEERPHAGTYREPSAAYVCAKVGVGCDRMKE